MTKDIEIIFENFKEILATVNSIKQLYAQLPQHSDKDIRHGGEDKTLFNSVETFIGKLLHYFLEGNAIDFLCCSFSGVCNVFKPI